jgi:FtsK/SpoIIIE family
MKHKSLLYFLLTSTNIESLQHNYQDSSDAYQEIICTQKKLLLYILSLNYIGSITLSLRYSYNISSVSRKNIELFVKFSSDFPQYIQEAENDLISFLNKGAISKFYNFEQYQYPSGQIYNFDWVNYIGEIIKPEKFDYEKGYYQPYLFEANKNNTMSEICDILHNLKENFLLEISLQLYPNSNEQMLENALAQMIAQLQLLTTDSQETFAKTALDTYKQYQTSLLNRNLFKYSIKVLAENREHLRTVLMTFLESATETSNCYGKQSHIEIISKDIDRQKFLESLQATENIEISTNIQHKQWESGFWDKYIREPIKQKLNNQLGDGSTNIYRNRFNSTIYNNPSLPSSGGQINQADHPIVAKSSDSLAKPAFAKVKDLKPLHRLVTLEEFSGFFRLPLTVNKFFSDKVKNNFPKATAEEILKKYSVLITADEYIVGLDDNGNPIISSWDDIPHRLVAGVTGSGKSNFLKWVIFQFLYVNPKRKIYIADFKGVDFQPLRHLGLNIEIETDIEKCITFVDKIHSEEYEKRQNLMQEYEVLNLKGLQEEDVDIDRTLWIIDEAADIADASSKLRDKIENKLKEYARKGRSFGIHIIYCTQRPNPTIISKQVTDQCEEKVVFRVSHDASYHILGDEIAGNIPNEAVGRGYLNGSIGKMFVNTPLIKMPSGKKILISDTIWSKLSVN